MTFDEAVKVLEEKQKSGAKGGLEAVSACLRKLGSPHEKTAFIHTAGTNGKGSVCAFLDSILRCAGYSTGLYTSPHLVDITERIKVNGESIAREELGAIIGEVAGAEESRLNFFETLTCAAFLYFRRKKVDIAVIEAGLGGRLDATNVIPKPLLSVITSVSLDHTRYLGKDTVSIAAEKAGIFKTGTACVCGPVNSDVRGVIEDAALTAGVDIKFLSAGSMLKPVKFDWAEGIISVKDAAGRSFQLGLMGRHQIINASIAVKCIDRLAKKGFAVNESALAGGLKGIRWPGRFQIMETGISGKSVKVILDGAHNPAAASALSETISEYPLSGEKPVFLIGMMRDKDYCGFLRNLSRHLEKVIVTVPVSGRAMDPHMLADTVQSVRPDADVEVHSEHTAAFFSAVRRGTPVVVTGSLYLVGNILKLLDYRGNNNDRNRR